MTKDSLLKKGGQAFIIHKGKKSISKVFISEKSFQRENNIQLNFIQPLNKIFKNKPFAEAYPQKNTKNLNKKEFKMKKYDGDLQTYLDKNPNLSEEEVRLLFVKIIYPVFILHRCKIYHGDLKPENYLYKICKRTKELFIYLTDFGGADILSSRNEKIHTPYCYSHKFHPINLLDQNHPHFNPFSADCYMLGVILSRMSSHLKDISSDLRILLDLLINYELQIEQLILFRWINCSEKARDLILKLSKASQDCDQKENTSENKQNMHQLFGYQQSLQIQNPISQNIYYQPIQYQYQVYNPYSYPYDFNYVQLIQNSTLPYSPNSIIYNNLTYNSYQQSLSFSQ
ncbi:kinase domain protein (macronuclear) [Tetrahymena thermophila SB210]|uniref:Kinase domain protein n=1 Tax=Tetrahymena thermophila (strain SB210) TaxID=312017 RepID=Q239Y0_TETTS|nr:kinase domain protein [Tetrahymena thermophila SB210]EAR93383.1 kinase domain protein [Tetrahymena thermophila SB210]|eukprot:XP_001013628.1 kinase domain protein [Tetrahymena thermophila SB210]